MKSKFTADLSTLNRIDSGLWLLGPGMTFGDTTTWWKDQVERPLPHNGVDLAFMRTPDGTQHNLGPGTIVPAPFDGQIACIIPDFIALSVFIVHNIEENGGRLISGLGHITPHTLLKPGVTIKSGATVGNIAKPKDKSIPPHLHLTLATIPKDFPPSKLNWQELDNNKDITPIDPRKYF
jgi:hypothetical protein